MARSIQEAFDEAFTPAKSRRGFTDCRFIGIRNFRALTYHLDTATTTAVSGFDCERKPMFVCEIDHFLCRFHGVGRARGQWRTDPVRNVSGSNLVAEGFDGSRRWTNPDQAGVEHCLGKLSICGKESITWMDGVSARVSSSPEYLLHGEVGIGYCVTVQ